MSAIPREIDETAFLDGYSVPRFLIKIMMPMMEKIGPMFGMSGTLSDAAHRYLKILDFDETTNGRFWVSKKGKMAGPLVLFSSSYIDNIDFQNAVWEIVDGISNPLNLV